MLAQIFGFSVLSSRQRNKQVRKTVASVHSLWERYSNWRGREREPGSSKEGAGEGTGTGRQGTREMLPRCGVLARQDGPVNAAGGRSTAYYHLSLITAPSLPAASLHILRGVLVVNWLQISSCPFRAPNFPVVQLRPILRFWRIPRRCGLHVASEMARIGCQSTINCRYMHVLIILLQIIRSASQHPSCFGVSLLASMQCNVQYQPAAHSQWSIASLSLKRVRPSKMWASPEHFHR
jgi:hypothetical protein